MTEVIDSGGPVVSRTEIEIAAPAAVWDVLTTVEEAERP